MIKYPYSHDVNGDEHRFHIHHGMGEKYSIYLSSLYENVLNEFDITSEFKITESSITFMVNTKKPSSASQCEQVPLNSTKTLNENTHKLI